jgi:hypothetical protein
MPSLSFGGEWKSDTLEPVAFIVPRHVIDSINASTEICDFLRVVYPETQNLLNLYRKGLKATMRIDTIQTRIISLKTAEIEALNKTHKEINKILVRNKIKGIWQDIKEPLLLLGGFVLGLKYQGL